MSRIAFYATIKPPDHPIASGDRLIAKNLISALTIAGHEVELASRFIAYSKREDAAILSQRKRDALVEAQRVLVQLRDNPPDLWITYHPYCKAPDWIGPVVSRELNIPYVTVEAARTGQGFENGEDRWANWRVEAQSGMRLADRHIALKPTDRQYLSELLGSSGKIGLIAPFIDTAQYEKLPAISYPTDWRPGAPVLVTVGMMRPGKKTVNYQKLAEALTPLQSLHWNLVIVGDGPEEETVREYFSSFDPARLLFAGAVKHEHVLAHMAGADLFVWPGWKEPIGMVYLEAQMMGLPVAALDSMGVSLTVHHGKTGLLAGEIDMGGFTENLSTLISHPTLRQDFGRAAKVSVQENHSLNAAAKALNKELLPLLAS